MSASEKAKARKTFDESETQARKVFDEAMAPAQKALDEALDREAKGGAR